jgi:hypothetical protein
MEHYFEDHKTSLLVDITYLEVKLAGEQKLQVTYVVDILSQYLLLWFC